VLQTGISTIALLPKGHECIAIIAAEHVLSIAVTLPSGGRRRWQSLLPYIAEEFTLTDPEDNHVVPGQKLSDGRRMLAIINKSLLKHIVDAAQSTKLSLRRMVVETFLPALATDSWTLVWDGSGGFVKTDTGSGTVLDISDAGHMPLALRLSLDGASKLPQKIELRFAHEVEKALRNLPQWEDLQLPLVSTEDWDWRRDTIPEDALNLLWGSFVPRAKLREWWPKIRPATYLLLAVLAVEMLGSNLEWAMLANERNQLSKEMQHIFRATFGDTATLVNAPLQMQRNLAEFRHVAGVQDAGDFLPLLNAASTILGGLPVGSVLGLHYETGRLDVDLRLASSRDFLNLKRVMQKSGLGVRMGDVRDLGSFAEARLTLVPEGAP
jgi:general secretion pathway protein L